MKCILEQNKNYSYNVNFFNDKIQEKFNSKDMQLHLCNKIGGVFDDKPKQNIAVKKYNNDQKITDTDKYFVFKKGKQNWGISKCCCNNKYLNIENLIKQRNIINTEYSTLQNITKYNNLKNALNDTINIQKSLILIHHTLANLNDCLNILKQRNIGQDIEEQVIKLKNIKDDVIPKALNQKENSEEFKTLILVITTETNLEFSSKKDIKNFRKQIDDIAKHLEQLREMVNREEENHYFERLFNDVSARTIEQQEIINDDFKAHYKNVKSELIKISNILQQDKQLKQLNNQILALRQFCPTIVKDSYELKYTQFQHPQNNLVNIQQIVNSKLPGIKSMQIANKDDNAIRASDIVSRQTGVDNKYEVDNDLLQHQTTKHRDLLRQRQKKAKSQILTGYGVK